MKILFTNHRLSQQLPMSDTSLIAFLKLPRTARIIYLRWGITGYSYQKKLLQKLRQLERMGVISSFFEGQQRMWQAKKVKKAISRGF
jgi:hypothetical protein